MTKSVWLIVVVIMLFSPLAGFEFVVLIDAIGIDIFAMLLEAQLLVITGLFLSRMKQAVLYVHEWMMQRDVNYFIPSKEIIRAYPPMIIHAVPELFALPVVAVVITIKAIQLA